VLPVIGWIVGVVLLWASNAWTVRDKLIGTLVLPGGLMLPFGLFFLAAGNGGGGGCVQVNGGPETCTDDGSQGLNALALAILVVTVLAPIVTTAYLALRMRTRTAAATA